MLIELVAIGTGKGATTVTTGECSSSFAILRNDQVIILVDIGYGVFRSFNQIFGKMRPHYVYVSHNHSDHAGELPIYIMLERQEKRSVNIIAAPLVLERLMKHRLAEHENVGQVLLKKLPYCLLFSKIDELAHWIELPEGKKQCLFEQEGIFIEPVKSKHSETCYGFLLYLDEKCIFGFTGDSGFEPEMIEKLGKAAVIVTDGRDKSTQEHLSYEEVESLRKSSWKNSTVLVTHYGTQEEAPKSLPYLKIGERVTIFKED